MYEGKCHAISDDEIAEIFEMEVGRGEGCVVEEGKGVHFYNLYTEEEANCLVLLRSLGVC